MYRTRVVAAPKAYEPPGPPALESVQGGEEEEEGGGDASARLMRRLEMEEYSDDDDDGDDGGGGGTTRAGVGVGGDVAALRALKTALSKPLASDADVRRVLRGEKRAGYMKTTRALELRREARLGGGGRRERTKRDA